MSHKIKFFVKRKNKIKSEKFLFAFVSEHYSSFGTNRKFDHFLRGGGSACRSLQVRDLSRIFDAAKDVKIS